MFTFAIDKERLLRHFQKDPVLFGYHIGDLDDRYFPDCQFACTYNETAHILESVLIYSGLATPTVLAFGVGQDFGTLLEELLPTLPLRLYSHYQLPYREIFRSAYRETDLGGHFKMRLEKFSPASRNLEHTEIVRLTSADSVRVVKFYRAAYPDGYFEPKMLDSGKFIGAIYENNLVAVSGVHIYSPKYKISVLGSIATHPDFRGKGYASVLTSNLCEELTKEKLLVCLNVKADNQAAINRYQRLGFTVTHEYQEALFELRD